MLASQACLSMCHLAQAGFHFFFFFFTFDSMKGAGNLYISLEFNGKHKRQVKLYQRIHIILRTKLTTNKPFILVCISMTHKAKETTLYKYLNKHSGSIQTDTCTKPFIKTNKILYNSVLQLLSDISKILYSWCSRTLQIQYLNIKYCLDVTKTYILFKYSLTKLKTLHWT